MTLDVNMLLFTLAGNSLMEVDSFLVLLAIVRWNQILLFIFIGREDPVVAMLRLG